MPGEQNSDQELSTIASTCASPALPWLIGSGAKFRTRRITTDETLNARCHHNNTLAAGLSLNLLGGRLKLLDTARDKNTLSPAGCELTGQRGGPHLTLDPPPPRMGRPRRLPRRVGHGVAPDRNPCERGPAVAVATQALVLATPTPPLGAPSRHEHGVATDGLAGHRGGGGGAPEAPVLTTPRRLPPIPRRGISC